MERDCEGGVECDGDRRTDELVDIIFVQFVQLY